MSKHSSLTRGEVRNQKVTIRNLYFDLLQAVDVNLTYR